MTKTRPSFAQLRQEILHRKTHELPKGSNDDPMDRWIRRHHDRICDYLLEGLRDRELPGWYVAYTALHEMLGAVYFQPRDFDHGEDEKRIWASFDPGYFVFVHFPALRPFSFLPEDFSPHAFEPHYGGFFHFLAKLGLFDPAHARLLEEELHDALWGEALGVA